MFARLIKIFSTVLVSFALSAPPLALAGDDGIVTVKRPNARSLLGEFAANRRHLTAFLTVDLFNPGHSSSLTRAYGVSPAAMGCGQLEHDRDGRRRVGGVCSAPTSTAEWAFC